jgi:hypothetical protein
MVRMPTPFDEDDPTPRATPGKRPAAPPPKGPAKPAGKANVPVVPPAEPESLRLAWGHVGSVTRPGRLSDGTSRPGVIRVVEAGISYFPPALEPYVWSQASLNYVGQYEMAWPEGDPAAVRSLADFAAELQRGTPSKTQLKMLDQIADALLANTEKLHEQDQRLGLLELGNVLIVPGSEGRTLVLPDLGFVWRGSHGKFPWKDSPGRPRWLDEDARANQNAKLWDEEPVWQQFTSAEAAGDDHDPVPPQSDLKTLARMFAAVLTGRIERDISPPNQAPVWTLLRSILKGDIGTAAEFRRRLNEHRLSGHWLNPNGPPKPSANAAPAALLGCLALLLLLSAGVAALYFAGYFDSATVASNTQPTSGSHLATATTSAAKTSKSAGPAHPLDKKEVDWKNKPKSPPEDGADTIRKLDQAKDPKLLLDLLTKLYQQYEAGDAATRDKLRPWVEFYRGVYLDGWVARYRDADDEVIKNIGLRYEAGRRIHDLYQELAGLRQQYEPISPSLNEREMRCLEISELRSRELGSPQ